MFLEILACVGVYSLAKGIGITIQSDENERNFIEHLNRSKNNIQNRPDGFWPPHQLGSQLGSNPREYWEDKIRNNRQGHW